MRYDEVVKLSWREDTGDEFETAEVWSSIQDSGTASFDVGSGLTLGLTPTPSPCATTACRLR